MNSLRKWICASLMLCLYVQNNWCAICKRLMEGSFFTRWNLWNACIYSMKSEHIKLTSIKILYAAHALTCTGAGMEVIDAERTDRQRPRPGLQSWQQWQYRQAGITGKLNSRSSVVQTLCPQEHRNYIPATRLLIIIQKYSQHCTHETIQLNILHLLVFHLKQVRNCTCSVTILQVHQNLTLDLCEWR
jgi:hypothetical protein